MNLAKGALLLAPIAGYSDTALRTMCLRYGASLCFTEMVSAKGIYYKNENTADLLHIGEGEKNTAVQIFGSDPDIMAEVINYDCLKDFQIIDINMGCPVPKVVKNGEGSCLMRNPDLVYEIVKAVKDSAKTRDVTVKMRAGFYNEYQNAEEVAVACQEGGASMVTVHGRTREMFYSGRADLDIIRRVNLAVKIPVTGNGDVASREDYLRMLEYTGVDYVMVARGAIGRPYVFAEILGNDYTFDVRGAMLEHVSLLSASPQRVVLNAMKRQVGFYLKGYKNHKAIKEQFYKAETLSEIISIIEGMEY